MLIRSIVLVGVAVFLELHDALHQGRTFKVELGRLFTPSLVPACTWSRSNFSDEVFFLGCRNLGMICVKIRHYIKGEVSPWLQPRRGFRAPPLRVLRRRTRKTMQGECRSHARMAMAEPQGFL